MAKKTAPKQTAEEAQQGELIAAYSQAQTPAFQKICDELRVLIDKAMPNATAKVWHGSPVWFIDENPVVGYNTSTRAVHLLFWNGQAIDEKGLVPVGKYKAAQASYADIVDLDSKSIKRWLKAAKEDIFDSKTFFANLRAKKKVTKK